MRRTVRAILVAASAALLGASVAGAAAEPRVDGGATASAPAVRIEIPERALLVSDSAWLGMQYYAGIDQVQGFDHLLSLASCRRRVSTSCTNYDGYVPITAYEEVAAAPAGYTTLIVATGYNDGDQRFAQDVDAIVSLARARGHRRVVWLTLRSNVTYQSPGDAGYAEVFERSNAVLERIVADGTYPELVIADWATYARDRPGWFASDGIHLRNLGAYAAGDYISRKMAFLYGEPCPQPETAGAVRSDPCPDPDSHGPVVDLESLYPVGQRDPSMRFTLSFVGSSSWPEPPWWETG